jgi:alpha-beta hydrolase superfamily lysophospholipase
MVRRGVGRVIVAAMACGALLGALPAAASPAPDAGSGVDAFYTPPSPLPRKAAGTPIRTQAIGAPRGARAWRVLYHSRAVDGADIAVSGVVVAPVGSPPAGGRPVVAWAHGTTGLADQCAPSRQPDVVAQLPALREFLRAGYVIAATDYEGLGTPGPHPYLEGESEAHSVLDAARAARAMRSPGAGRRVLVFGHSQGGHAALFAGELAASYAPELRLAGVAAAAPLADLSALLPAATSSTTALGLFVMGVYGFHAAWPQADPASVLTPLALARANVLDQACALGILVAYQGPPAAVIAHNPATVPPWPDLIQRSSSGSRPIPVPTLILQGGRDPLIQQPFTDAFVRKDCAVGTRIDYRVFPTADHGSVITQGRHDVVAFFRDVLAHRRVPDGCGVR